jgi:GNAT superfamily N-acetyltransferase
VTAPDKISSPEPLRADHALDLFDCGVSPLDDWLKRRALANESAGASRTFVVVADGRVVGYYSLAAAAVAQVMATAKIRRNMPDPVPAVLIGRLALDKSMHGKGLGAGLLRDALLRIAGAAHIIGVRAVLVHALSNEAKTFYERFGFRPSPIEPMTLMVTVEEVRRALG